MSTLVVVAYPNEFQAEEVRLRLLKMQQEYLVDLEDAVIAVRKEDGKIKLLQLHNLTGAGAVSGGFWGLAPGPALPSSRSRMLRTAGRGVRAFRYSSRRM